MTTFADYTNITTGLFVDWYIPNYSEGAGIFPFNFRFSDYHRYIEFAGDTVPTGSIQSRDGYLPLRRLLSISPSKNQVLTSGDNVTITINAYNAGDYRSMTWLRNSRIEGSEITIKRAVFDDQGELLPLTIGNPVGRFKGFVESYTVNDTYDITTGKSDTVIVLSVTDYKNSLTTKISGRKTARPYAGGWFDGFLQPGDSGYVPGLQSPIYIQDRAFDKVAKLANTKFAWGKPE